MKKIILPILLLTILAWCGQVPDTTREDTVNWIIVIMSGNSAKRNQANTIIENNNKMIEQYEKSNQFQNEILVKMEDANNQYRDTLCTMIWQDEKWYKCDPIVQ